MRAAIVYLAVSLAALGGCASTKKPEPPKVMVDPGPCVDREFNVYFESWKSELSPEAKAEMTALQGDLKSCTIEKVKIVGMAGAPGDPEDNLKISQERADFIAANLEAGGWSKDVFDIKAIGEKGATTAEGLDKPMRRRVHVEVKAVPKP
ncbi:MAG: OmpA family protein [Caulobacterales bacterium]